MIMATLCYVKKNNKTLMIHRVKKKNDMHQGKWNGLGGKLNDGETPEECVIREVWEESGLEIEKPKLKGILTFPEFSQGKSWYVFLYEAREFTGSLIESCEGNLEWIKDEEFVNLNLWQGDRYFLKWMDENKFFSAKFIYKDGELKQRHVFFH